MVSPQLFYHLRSDRHFRNFLENAGKQPRKPHKVLPYTLLFTCIGLLLHSTLWASSYSLLPTETLGHVIQLNSCVTYVELKTIFITFSRYLLLSILQHSRKCLVANIVRIIQFQSIFFNFFHVSSFSARAGDIFSKHYLLTLFKIH